MIEFSNASKVAANGSEEFIDIKKYIGVASIKIVGLNPNNSKLRMLGWTIPVDAKEPEYVMTDENGKITAARLRFLAEIQDFEDKPVVALDFWIRPEYRFNADKTKAKIIDKYGRTAFGLVEEEIKKKKIPQYSNGPAKIDAKYKPCHDGEEELVTFLLKHLNVSPLQTYSRLTGGWQDNANPGSLTIDNWGELCKGNVKEIESYLALQPENMCKVALGIRVKDDNKTYQTFLNTAYLGNGARVDMNTGKYTKFVAEIEKFKAAHPNVASQYIFEASPVHEWKETATEVEDTPNVFEPKVDDLPF